MERTETNDHHEKYEELCALAQTGSLSIGERLDLKRHLQACRSCRQIIREYAAIGETGMAFLAADFVVAEEADGWDNREARLKLHSSIKAQGTHNVLSIESGSAPSNRQHAPSNAMRVWAMTSLAACLTIAVASGAYYAGQQRKVARAPESASLQPKQGTVPSIQRRASLGELSPANLPASDKATLLKLQQQISSGQQELARLRTASDLSEERAKTLEALNDETATKLQMLSDERDSLTNRLNEAEKAYQALQVDFANLKAERDRTLLRATSLETGMTELTATAHDQERRLKDDEQYLTSDRDIRELMGARKLYIADVFDVDSGSHTRKPFGRVFYTQNKSLVFYAFDLDHQSGVKNASVFQVWGQRDSQPNAETHPMNLGILYMDSESSRRWVLRSDDPKQLAEIDAVFVTVEPHGGSQKPTGKPLLYALLRKEANHP